MEQVPVEALKEGAWREIARIDLALEAGEIDERGWHEAIAELVRGRYLAATTPWGQSGKGGDEAAWVGARRFDVVRAGLEYVPARRRGDLARHLLRDVAVPGGRVVLGPFSEEPDRHATEDALASWGLPPSGGSQVPHPDPRVVRRLLWIDA